MRLTTRAALASTCAVVLSLTAPAALAAQIDGTSGNDNLTGTAAKDGIEAKAGNDLVQALGGDDVVKGGPGSDLLYGNAGADKLYGGRSGDRTFGGYGADLIADAHGTARDVLTGGPGADRIYANYRDRVVAGPDDDVIEAVYPHPDMSINCGTGNDRVVFNQKHPGVELISCERVRIVSAG